MPADLSYMPSVANLANILNKIKAAATPPKFTYEFLKANLGFGSSNDRSVIKLLKSMGFLSNDGNPTELYNEYRGSSSGGALARGVRNAYAPLFLSDEKIYTKSGPELIGIVKNATGAGDAVAKKIATTFKTLAEKADWEQADQRKLESTPTVPSPTKEEPVDSASEPLGGPATLRLHHDIHLHLPPTSDVSVYRAIFQAMKSELT